MLVYLSLGVAGRLLLHIAEFPITATALRSPSYLFKKRVAFVSPIFLWNEKKSERERGKKRERRFV